MFVAHIKREHKTNIFEKQNNDTGRSPPKIIKTEYGQNVEIKLEMAMAKREENNQETSVAVMDKKLKLHGAIVEISSEEKLNAKTFNTKDKSVYFEGVKQ